ncbi:MAG: peptidoglycan recognition family protein [Anaerolineae bacterium]
MVDSPVPHVERRYFPETGCTVEGAFLDFLQQYGIDFCGLPLTDSFLDAGVPTQYFQRIALEEAAPGQLRLKAIGAEVIHLREQLRQEKLAPLPQPSGIVLGIPPFDLVNQVGSLPRHATLRYASRPLDYIRQLVIHHTGASESVGAEQIAGYHVTTLGWPGVGYHFIIDRDGRVAQTNALATISHHARQYNGSGVGIALAGNLDHTAPPPAQLDGAALLCAWLLRELNLPIEAIKGHQELVSVTCPGDQWLEGARWKFALMDRVERLLAGAPLPPHDTLSEPPVESVAATAPPTEDGPGDAAPVAAAPEGGDLVMPVPDGSHSPAAPSPAAAAPTLETPEAAPPTLAVDNHADDAPGSAEPRETPHPVESSNRSRG